MDILTLAMAKAYTDSQRLGYTESSSKVFLKETEFEFAPSEMMEGCYDAVVGGIELINAIGDTTSFTVLFDGKAYPCEGMPRGPNIFFGNFGLMGEEDTGEPFMGLTSGATGTVTLFTTDAGEHTIGIKSETETVHTIDPKYLPSGMGGGSTVIDLSKYTLLTNNAEVPLSIEIIVTMLFSEGGGSVYGTDENGFWDVVKTSNQLKFVLVPYGMGLVINADGTCHVKDTNGNSVTIEMSFLVNASGWKRVTVIFDNSRNDGTAGIHVAVEPLTIPGT